jgi:hypothetical protein
MGELQGLRVCHHGKAPFKMKGKEGQHVVTAGAVKVLQRFVEEQDARLVEQCPCPAQSLPHAGGKGARCAVEREGYVVEQKAAAGGFHTAQAAGEVQVLRHREFGIKLKIGCYITHCQTSVCEIEGASLDRTFDGATLWYGEPR